ncbi:MAG TPA: hypothetical protein IAC50_07755, partial [Candidatus Copromorpha excrementigallinarum]|nr:hypothetical protein [Candidatus Copromorpha excrementigallinarum]
METNNETFSYVYSPKQQEEIENIRKKYLPEDEAEDKMEQLRRLDRNAVKPGTAASLIIGIIGALTLGAGMCCTMVWGGQLFIPGIGIGLAGI